MIGGILLIGGGLLALALLVKAKRRKMNSYSYSSSGGLSSQIDRIRSGFGECCRKLVGGVGV